MKMDTSTEAVERLLDGVTPGDWSSYSDDDDPDCPAGFQYSLHSSKYGCVGYWTGHKDNHKDERWYLTEADARFIAAARDLVPALLKERDEAIDAKLDALSTLDAWFDRRKLGNEAVNQAVIDAASGYLRTSRVGGMPQVESDLILGVMQDMSRIGLFADIFARAMDDLVPALLKERDEARALAASQPADTVANAGCCQAVKVKPQEPAPVAPAEAALAASLRITGPNSDGEYWLHIKAGGRSGGVNLGGEHGPICKRLLDAASETGAKE